MVTLDQLHLFTQVAAAGSFSAAARELGRAQSAVSYAIANLEAQLGVALFDRSGHRPALTEAGEALLGDARSVSSRVDALLARARWLASREDEVRLGLAVDVLFPIDALIPQLAELKAQFAHVALEVHTEALGGVARLVLEGRCDLGVGMSFGDIPAALDHRLAIEVPSVGVAAASHPLAQLEPGFAPEMLEDHIQIVLTDKSGITKGQQRGVLSSTIWRVADLHTKRALLLAGFGWGTMPLHLVETDLHAGTLAPIHHGNLTQPFTLELHVMWRRAEPPGPAGRWLLDRLVHRPPSGP